MSTERTTALTADGAFTLRAWLYVTAALSFSTVIPALYFASFRELPTAYRLAAWLLNGLLFWHLLTRDRALLSMPTPPTDFGLLVLLLWPVLVPYHLFATRGRHGWRLFLCS